MPAVVTPVGAIPELVQDEKSGLFVPVSDAGALANAFARLAADPALGQRLSRAGRADAQARFAIATMLDLMEDIFRKAVLGRP